MISLMKYLRNIELDSIMKDKSQSPRKIFENSDIYEIHSYVKECVNITADILLAGLMGNYQE